MVPFMNAFLDCTSVIQYGGSLAADANLTVNPFGKLGSVNKEGSTIIPTCPVPSLPFAGQPVATISPGLAPSGPAAKSFQHESDWRPAQSAARKGCVQSL